MWALAAVFALLAAMAALGFGANRSGSATAGEAAAAMGEAREASLTVDVPPPVTTRIYSAPGAAGRPIVVIDAGHGGRDPGATSVSGEVNEKALTPTLSRARRDTLVKRG